MSINSRKSKQTSKTKQIRKSRGKPKNLENRDGKQGKPGTSMISFVKGKRRFPFVGTWHMGYLGGLSVTDKFTMRLKQRGNHFIAAPPSFDGIVNLSVTRKPDTTSIRRGTMQPASCEASSTGRTRDQTSISGIGPCGLCRRLSKVKQGQGAC
jgi:hypothetical protein